MDKSHYSFLADIETVEVQNKKRQLREALNLPHTELLRLEVEPSVSNDPDLRSRMQEDAYDYPQDED